MHGLGRNSRKSASIGARNCETAEVENDDSGNGNKCGGNLADGIGSAGVFER